MLANIRKALDAGYQEVYSVGIDESTAVRIRRDLLLSGVDREPKVKVGSLAKLSIL